MAIEKKSLIGSTKNSKKASATAKPKTVSSKRRIVPKTQRAEFLSKYRIWLKD